MTNTSRKSQILLMILLILVPSMQPGTIALLGSSELNGIKFIKYSDGVDTREFVVIRDNRDSIAMSLATLRNGIHHAILYSENYFLIGDFDIQFDFDLVDNPDEAKWFLHLQASSLNPQPHPLLKDRPDEEIRVTIEHNGQRRYGGEIRHDGSPRILEGAGKYHTTSDASGRLRIKRTGAIAYTYYWHSSGWVLLNAGRIGQENMSLRMWLSSIGNPSPDVSAHITNLVVIN